MLKPHVVILGAGFGGTYVAKKLAKHVKAGLIDVTIVNKTNYFLFTPLLHEVATGSLSPTSVAEPLREVFAGTGIALCQGIVKSVDLGEHRVHMSSIGSQHTLPYDYLVIATGAETNYYGIPGAEKYCLPLKSLSDAVNIRTHIIDCFEESVMCDDPIERAQLLSFVVVGGGPTGVETVAELTEFVHGIVDRYYFDSNLFDRNEVKITLIHAGAELVQQFSPVLRKSVLDHIKAKGVDVRLDARVINVTSHTLSLTTGSVADTIPTSTVIWAAGVKSITLDFIGSDGLANAGSTMSTNGRLDTDSFLRVNNDERVFALGDTAGVQPMLAQVAVQQADIVSDNIMASINQKTLKTFSYKSHGSLVSVGKWFAVGEVFNRIIKGRFAWWIWRTTYLSKFASLKKRLRIMFEWTLQLFFPRDITKLN
ncbi:MAG: NAD(P)/FAD-dependent oxidoreductase [Candidatus Taylorbacteria bacterium]